MIKKSVLKLKDFMALKEEEDTEFEDNENVTNLKVPTIRIGNKTIGIYEVGSYMIGLAALFMLGIACGIYL